MTQLCYLVIRTPGRRAPTNGGAAIGSHGDEIINRIAPRLPRAYECPDYQDWPRPVAPMSPEPAAERLGFVTLEQFLHKLPPELKILHDGGNGAGLLRWVEPSELADPTPYLLDGEFILTAGLPFLGDGGGAGSVDSYVERLVGAGVGALGFGLEPYFDAVPDSLIDVRAPQPDPGGGPQDRPFAAIGLEFSQLLESDNAGSVPPTGGHQQATDVGGPASPARTRLLAAPVQRVPVWALLVGADGRIRALRRAGRTAAGGRRGCGQDGSRQGTAAGGGGQGPGPPPSNFPPCISAAAAAAAAGRQRSPGGDGLLRRAGLVPGVRASAAQHPGCQPGRPGPGQRCPADPGAEQRGVLRRRAPGTPGPPADQRLTWPPASWQPPCCCIRTAWRPAARGTSTASRTCSAQSISSTRSGTASRCPGHQGGNTGLAAGDSPVRELLQWRRLFDTKLVELTEYGFAAITRLKVDDALLADVEKLGWRLVIGDATEFPGLAAAHQRVTSLRARVQSTGKSARVDEVTWSVAGLLGREAGTMLAARLLEPVLNQDPERRQSQLAVLKTWLGENGSWDGTAKALGLHRNSVRRQVNALAELPWTDLNQAQVRAELWIALQYVDELDPAGGAGNPTCGSVLPGSVLPGRVLPGTVDVRPALPEVRHGVPGFLGGHRINLGEEQLRRRSRGCQQRTVRGRDDAAAQEFTAVFNAGVVRVGHGQLAFQRPGAQQELGTASNPCERAVGTSSSWAPRTAAARTDSGNSTS